MKRSIGWALVAVSLAVFSMGLAPAEAGGARGAGYHRSARVGRAKPSVRLVQIDGRSLWDLGNQMGTWPTTR